MSAESVRTAEAAARVFSRPVFARARRLCLSLPGTIETVSWGHPSFKVGKKMFCVFEIIEGRPTIAFRVGRDRTQSLMRKGFIVTPYGRGLWASVRVDQQIDWPLVTGCVEKSWSMAAPGRLLK